MEDVMRRTLWLMVALMIILPLGDCFALDKKEGAPISVEAAPIVLLSEQPVTLSGNTTPDGTRFEVTLNIVLPDGKSKAIKTKADKKGDYKIAFSDTKQTGQYKVAATSPDGKGTAETEFTVTGPTGISQMASETFEELAKTIEDHSEKAKENIQKLPSSDERDELLAKAAELDKQLSELKQQANQLKPELDKMAKVLEEPTPVEINADTVVIIGELTHWTTEARAKMDSLKKSLPKERPKPDICETIHAAAEGLRLSGLLLNFFEMGVPLVLNLATDKGIPALLNLKYPKRHPLWDQPAKNAANLARGMGTFAGGAVGFANDMMTLLVDGLLDRYCGVYSGPIDATMSGVFKHMNNKYWTYSIKIEGQFVLRFPKDSPPGAPITLSGEIFGNATKYTFWEDVERVMEVPAGGQIVVRRPITPGPFPALYKDPLGLGQIANLALPPVFYIPIEGKMDGDLLALKLFDPVKEINSYLLKNQLIMVYMAFGLPVPAVQHFDFPMQGAHFILSRGMRNPAEIEVTKQGKARLLKKQFTRTWTSDDNQIEVNWVVNLNASNPPAK